MEGEWAGHPELIPVELLDILVVVQVLEEEWFELGEVDASPDVGDEGVGNVGGHWDSTASVSGNSGVEPGPECLCVREGLSIVDVWGEEDVEDVVLKPVG